MSLVDRIFKDMDMGEAKRYLVERRGDPLEAKPGGGGIVNVFFVVKALSDLILRHEGADDLVEVAVAGQVVPAITDSKFDAAYRRTMLYLQHNIFKEYGKDIASKISETLSIVADRPPNDNIGVLAQALLSADGLKLRVLDGMYNCALRPYDVGGKEYIEGYCRECPACFLFGFAVQEEGARSKRVSVTCRGRSYKLQVGSYNVQARVRGDLYPATAPSDKITDFRTHNAVDDVTKTTGRALMTIRYVAAGATFVGKISFYDVSLNELLLLLATLVKIPRIGAVWSDYGRVEITVPALVFADQELGSGYEIAERILSKGMGEDPVEEVVEYAKSFDKTGYVYVDRELTDRLFKLGREELKDIVVNAWRDAVLLKLSYEAFVQEIGRPREG